MTRTHTLSITALLASSQVALAAITLQPGTLLATDRTNNRLRQFDAATGAEIASLQLPIDPSRTLEGVALAGSAVHVTYASNAPSLREVSRVDLSTGALTPLALASAPVGLGARGADLIAVNRVSTTQYTLQRWTIAGAAIASPTLAAFLVLGVGEWIDDVAWTGARYATVSNFRGPGSGAFQVFEWDATSGSNVPPGRTFFYAAPDLLAEGFDVSPTDATYWFTSNPASGAVGTSYIDHINPVGGARTTWQVSGGVLSDIAYVSVPAPATLGVLAGALSLAPRRRMGSWGSGDEGRVAGQAPGQSPAHRRD